MRAPMIVMYPVACRKCGAEPGVQCRTTKGTPRTLRHAVRTKDEMTGRATTPAPWKGAYCGGAMVSAAGSGFESQVAQSQVAQPI